MRGYFLFTFLFVGLVLPALAFGGNYSRVEEGFRPPTYLPRGEYSGNFTPVEPGYSRPGLSMRMNDNLHKEFLENGAYELADALLNATWGLMKKNLSSREYSDVLDEQREWINYGRDVAANRLLGEMSPVKAYTRVMRERIVYLATIIAQEPRSGRFYNDDSQFRAEVSGNMVKVDGDAFFRDNICEYDGKGQVRTGWITMRHEDLPDFYLIFTRTGATIFYNTPGMDQGCGMNVGFSGDYSRK